MNQSISEIKVVFVIISLQETENQILANDPYERNIIIKFAACSIQDKLFKGFHLDEKP